MKKILTLLCAVLLFASCSKEENIQLASGEGAMRFALAAGSEISNDDTASIKIYKENEESGEYELVRRYTNTDDVPEKLALLEGNYKAVVQVGERMVVSFDELCYYGEQEFTIAAGQLTDVEVDCVLQSTIVKVVYDSNIAAKFNAGYATTVAIDDEYNQTEVNSGDVHSLKYTETKEGYFLMPEGQTTIAWQFEGSLSSESDAAELGNGGKITASAIIEDVKANARYTISLKYSADAPGNLVFEASVEEEPKQPTNDHNCSFSPDPTLLGSGFDITEVQYSNVARTYNISALALINAISITVDGATYDVLNTAIEGLTLTDTSVADNISYTLNIAPDFFANVTGGMQNVSIFISDVDGGKKTFDIGYACQGVYVLSTEDYDLWKATATFKACVLDTTATDIKIAYRAQGDEAWTELAATLLEGNSYVAVASDFAGDKTYEYKLVFGADSKGKTLSVVTPAGAQLPNGDMERWHTASWVLPYGQGDTPFWLTGNEGGNMVGATLTQSSTDVRPGSTGSYSAHLKSQYASFMGIGKFAAGNLFTGTFMLNGMDGIVTFGRDFNFTSKPKSLSFWMKNNEGTIDQGSHASGTDIYTVMVIITDGTTYSVNTKDESTFLKVADLYKTPGVIGYGYISGTDSRAAWTEETIDITYRDDMKDAKPKKIVVSFTPSGYGDYFCGSTSSWMYVDDVRFNY